MNISITEGRIRETIKESWHDFALFFVLVRFFREFTAEERERKERERRQNHLGHSEETKHAAWGAIEI